jgi:ABC-type uncharacterized transport system permease subunit
MDWGLAFLRAALIFYALGFLAALAPLLSEGRRRTGGLTPWLALTGAACHTAALFALGWSLQRCPLSTLPETLSALSWASVLLYLAVWWVYRIEVLHVVILPLSIVVLFVSKIMPGEVLPVAAPMRAPLLRLHLTTIILGVAALFITFAASLVYLIIDRALKAKRPARFFASLPSLERCDRIGRQSLLWAFPLLTFGIVTGAVVNESLTGNPWAWRPRETLAVIAWALLGLVLAARLGWGWRGRKSALLTILGFGLVFLRMLGI